MDINNENNVYANQNILNLFFIRCKKAVLYLPLKTNKKTLEEINSQKIKLKYLDYS